MGKTKQAFSVFFAGSLLLFSAVAVSEGFYGPYDYTNPEHRRDKLGVVESYHWNADVQSGKRGVSNSFAADDLEYILRSFPNHHPALEAISRQWRAAKDMGIGAPPGADVTKPPEYWFQKAIDFAPQDGLVHLIYGVHLLKMNSRDEAGRQLETALRLNPDSADVHYNLGLYYLDENKPDEALKHAWRAYELDYPLPGLRKRLMSAGFWRDPPTNVESKDESAIPGPG